MSLHVGHRRMKDVLSYNTHHSHFTREVLLACPPESHFSLTLFVVEAPSVFGSRPSTDHALRTGATWLEISSRSSINDMSEENN